VPIILSGPSSPPVFPTATIGEPASASAHAASSGHGRPAEVHGLVGLHRRGGPDGGEVGADVPDARRADGERCGEQHLFVGLAAQVGEL
jgi:hypothetical protein